MVFKTFLSCVGEAFYLFVLGWLLAQLEIQVEGAYGWAEKLPTWRFSPPWFLKITNGKPLTGYHFYLISFLFFVFHFPLCFVPFSKAVEAKIIASYWLMGDTWDFQWFVWNPAWGIKRFLNEKIAWFPIKLIGFPIEYYLGLSFSFLTLWALDPKMLSRWVIVAACLLTLNALAAFASLIKPGKELGENGSPR